MQQNLLILGAGQYGSVVKETALAIGAFEQIEFIDDNNLSAIGKLDELATFVGAYSHAFVAIGNQSL